MKKRIKIIALTISILMIMAVEAFSQGSSSATMQIRAEVVSGSQITRNTESEDKSLTGDEPVYGDFTMNLPEGADFVTETVENVELSNGSDAWNLNGEMKVEVGEDGKIHLKFVSKKNDREERKGVYQGTQMATIYYL